MPDLRIPYASLNGRPVHVDDVPTGLQSGCVCPKCGERLIAKNRKYKARKRVRHFSHAGTSGGGCGEGWLHWVAKMLLSERIEQGLAKRSQVPIAYRCPDCYCMHEGNLIKGVEAVRVETSIQGADIRPDLWLQGRYPKLVEIVVTHAPEQPVLEFSRAQSLPLVQVEIASVEDLEVVNSGLLPVEVHGLDQLCLCQVRARQRGDVTPCGRRWCSVPRTCGCSTSPLRLVWRAGLGIPQVPLLFLHGQVWFAQMRGQG